ncbi:tail fiber domain-containing protein [Spirosoma oryzicola]|uniref:tail fiber domain-containing protein n=1 Tax=Spirosoma oryzicola TaxID=2898794 RepID=UPI001E35A242|nr:tail fiber domain-containing protein [Spirosoma oryzicola]UHG91720.1 tail fiber domain-containing protein [Spirosoma oryzicola]
MKNSFTKVHRAIYIVLCIALASEISAQVLVGTPSGAIDGSASLDVRSGPYPTGNQYRGLVTPKLTTQQRNQIQSPATGLLIFNTTTNQIEVNSGTASSPVWTTGGSSNSGGAWSLTGNAGTVDKVNYFGTPDNVPITFKVFNQPAGRIDHILFNLGLGFFSINPNTTGTYNTAVGSYTLRNNTTGIANTAVGAGALTTNTSGTANTGVGHDALIGNVDGRENTAVGQSALRNNTSGFSNTALGADAMNEATTSYDNTALGASAQYNTTTGYSNTAAGALALFSNTTGYNNVGVGNYALQNNVTGYLNSSLGFNAGPSSGNGSVHHAIAIGAAAVPNAIYSIAIGADVTINSSANGLSTAIGALSSVGANVSNSTAIGARSIVNSSNTIVLGDANISSLRCNVQSISTLSDKRIKDDVTANVPGLSFITRLKPVTYYINKSKEAKILGYPLAHVQKDTILHSGFLAQDVEIVAKEIGYNFEGVRQEEGGKYYTLGYSTFVVPLVQAVKDLHSEVEQLKAQLEESKTAYKQLSVQVQHIHEILGVSKAVSDKKVSKKKLVSNVHTY